MKISQLEAEKLLTKDCEKFYNGVFAKVGKICNENQVGALISFCYNVGLGAFEKSTLLKVIKNNPNDEKIADEFMRYVFAGGKKLQGLKNRRKAEVGLYFHKIK